MRGLVQFFLFSGLAWFAAGTVFLAAMLIRKARFAPVARVVLLLSIAVAALSGTPVPWWLAIPLLGCTLGFIIFLERGWRALAVTTAVVVAAGLLYEAPYFFARPLRSETPKRIVVIGDSLSSGGFGEQTRWTDLLGVDNLAQPAETVSSAITYQAPRLPQSDADLVIVQIGGNDLLGGTPASQFARDLDRLLTLARAGGRRVVVFELPILPGKWMYGSHQRRLARKHGVKLIPKRVLARLLTNRSNVTDDALHLSQRGHETLAREVAYWLGVEYLDQNV